MIEEMKKLYSSFPFKTLEDYMKRAGISNGYQSKPCIDPRDPECPETAPNKHSQQVRHTHTHTLHIRFIYLAVGTHTSVNAKHECTRTRESAFDVAKVSPPQEERFIRATNV